MKKWIMLSEDGVVKYRKPILRVGDFQKKTEGKLFSFTQEHIDFFAESFSHKIPVPLEHTTEPDQNRGWCVGMEVEEDVLVGEFTFSDLVEDPNIFDTSVNIPIEDGRVQPIDHVALTSYPVVDGLGSFETISCSLIPVEEEPVAINWASIRTTLELSEDLTEENFVAVLQKRFADLQNEVALSKAPPKIDIEDIKAKHGGILKLAKEGREAKIAALPLSKGAKDKLAEVLCTEESLCLSLADTPDLFDEIVEALNLHVPLDEGELTGIQLSDSNKGEKESYLIRSAKARKAAAEKGN